LLKPIGMGIAAADFGTGSGTHELGWVLTLPVFPHIAPYRSTAVRSSSHSRSETSDTWFETGLGRFAVWCGRGPREHPHP
jgi:hypothetical protein